MYIMFHTLQTSDFVHIPYAGVCERVVEVLSAILRQMRFPTGIRVLRVINHDQRYGDIKIGSLR